MNRSPSTLFADERGFTETIGFFLLFSVLISSIIMVYAGGVGALLEIQYGSQTDAGEQVMHLLADDAKDVYQGDKSKESIEMQLNSVSFGTQTGPTMEITIENTASGATFTDSISSKTIVYRQESRFSFRVPHTRFDYSLGALFRTDDTNSVMLQEPPFYFNEDRVYLTGVELEGVAGVGGKTHAVTTLTEDSTVIRHQDSTANRDIRVTIHIETTPARAAAWARYFKLEGLTKTGRTDVSSGVVEYQFNTRSVVYKKTEINVEVTD